MLRGLVEIAPLWGVASDPQQSFEDVYAERTRLYESYAGFTEDASRGSAEGIALRICARLKNS